MADNPPLRPVEWIGPSRKDLRRCPDDIQWEIGCALYEVQLGKRPTCAKPMHGELRGVVELVVNHDGDTYRAMYTVKLRGAIYVLHVFQKKSTSGIATPRHELELIARRLREAICHAVVR